MQYPIVITSTANVLYYGGLKTSNGMLVIYKDKRIVITDRRYEEVAKKSGFEVEIAKGGQTLCDVALEVLERFGSEIVAYEDYDMLARDFLKFAEKYKMMPLSDDFAKVRAVKDKREITKMLTASKIASAAFEKAVADAKEGISEKALAAVVDFHMRALGADGVSFDTIVAFGKNASMPHHEPDGTKLQKGDCVLIDLGAKFEGYCSDMTRMFFLGEPSSDIKKVYDIVLGGQQEALKVVKSGVNCKDVDKVARDYITAHGYGDYFSHGLGHGVGLEIHEYPRLNGTSDAVLQEGMVVTVEPGIYLPGQFGIRIEDMIAVTDNGYINLTETNKKMIIK